LIVIKQIDLVREYNATKINHVLNHPSVRPWVADQQEGVIDISSQVANGKNYLLMGEHGGCFLQNIMEGIYELHTQVLPEGRGEWAVNLVHSVAHWMFTRTDACEGLTRVPENNKRAANLVKASNVMDFDFHRDAGMKIGNEVIGVNIYSARIQDWIKTAPFVAEHGQWFHMKLHNEMDRLGIDVEKHDEDTNHNQYVGACVEMMRYGRYAKAMFFYNRWAALSRHALVSLTNSDNPMLAIDVGVVKISGDDFELIPYGKDNKWAA